MASDPRVTLVSAVVVLACTWTVVSRARHATVPAPGKRADDADRAEVIAQVERSEPEWAVAAEESFPRDAWSQSDDFHGKERDLVRKLASERGVPLEDVLRAVDDDLHAAATQHRDAPDPRRARAVPCKPRPFYD